MNRDFPLHRLPRLTRKQRLVRNLTAAPALLFLLAWMLGFPAMTRGGLLRQGEREFLLEGSEILFTATDAAYFFDGPHTLYARNGDLLLTVNYVWTPLGRRLQGSQVWREEDNIRLTQAVPGVAGTYMAFGDLEKAARAELEVTLAGKTEVYDNETSLGDREYRETYVAEGVRENPYCFTFQLEPHHAENQILDGHWAAMEEQYSLHTPYGAFLAENAVLRLYDDGGELYHEKTVPWPQWDKVYFAR